MGKYKVDISGIDTNNLISLSSDDMMKLYDGYALRPLWPWTRQEGRISNKASFSLFDI